MQLGSGSFDFLPGLTYTGHAKHYSWGAQGRAEIRLNENSADRNFKLRLPHHR